MALAPLVLFPVVARANSHDYRAPVAVETNETLSYSIVPEKSLFAVVTRKQGLLARLAHDHVIAASRYTGKVTVVHDTQWRQNGTKAWIEFNASDLLVDAPEVRAQWLLELMKAKVFAAEPPVVKDDAREKVRANMLSSEQLDAAQFPTIRARLEVGGRDGALGHRALLHLTVKDKTVSTTCIVDPTFTPNGVEAVLRSDLPLAFSDFGIKPYSALGGTIAVKDEFELYAHLTATLTK